MCEDLAFAQQSLKTVLNDYADLFRKRFSEGLSIRKAADAMQQNRGVVERRQAALYRAFAQLLQTQNSSQRRAKMHRLDPIERLPDGSLFRLTPGQLRSVRGLTKRCCNFLDGDCLLLDGACPQYISRSLLCRWFRRAVLPQQLKLEQAILSPKKLRRCEVCGTGILVCSGRTKYCPACAKEVHRQQKAKSARKRRSGVDNLGAKSP